MKKKIAFIVTGFILLVVMNGCIKIETNLNVNKDGSGTIEETVLLSNEIVKMLTEFVNTFGDSSGAQSFNLFDEESLKQKASEYGEGVEYISGSEIIKDNFRGFKAVYSFDDLNKVTLSPDPNNQVSLGIENQVDSTDNDKFSFTFLPGESPEVIINSQNKIRELESGEFQETDDDMTKEDSSFIELLKEMKINMNLYFDGKIVKTNAAFRDHNKITLVELDFGSIVSDPETFEKFKRNKPSSLRDFNEIIKNIPGMKLETGYPVSVIFN